VAGDVIAELWAAAAAGEWAGAVSTRISILSMPAHHRAVIPSRSLTHAEITAALVQVRDAIDRAIDCGMAKVLQGARSKLAT